jgi:hypothetical protein
MKMHSRHIITYFIIIIIFTICGCATIPKESVELSYTIGNDLETLHQSYKLIITHYFDSLRREVNRSIEQVFIPAYINDYVETGQLLQHAQNKRADLVEAWARIAVETIDKERTVRLAPINEAEEELLRSVDDAFDKAIRANATITAHLNSIRQVKEVQDEILESLKLKNVRDKINDALVKASEKAKEITNEINEVSSELKRKSGEKM